MPLLLITCTNGYIVWGVLINMKKIKASLRVRSKWSGKQYLFATVFAAITFLSINLAGFGASMASATIQTGGPSSAQYTCGGTVNGVDESVKVSINIGCEGKGYGLVDALFAIIRFLSVGVGLVVVASIVWAGIQYSAARDDPSAVAKARERIQSTLIALLVYIFASAILDFVLPAGFLK